jgi:VWFA-related protein
MKTLIATFLLFILFAFGGQFAFSQSGRAKPAATPTPQSNGEQKSVAKTANEIPQNDKNQKGTVIEDEEVLRVETNLVTVPVSVLDRDGRYVPDLRREDFHLFENGVEQEIAFFASVDEPFTIVLLLDTSGSVVSSLDSIKRAAKVFVEQLRPNDRAAIITFAKDWHVLVEPTDDRERIYRAIDQMSPEPWTRLYDTVDYVLANGFKDVAGRKAVLLLTDGVDARSKHSGAKETIHRAEEGEAIFYTIRYDTGHFGGQSPSSPPDGRGLPFPIPGRKPERNLPDPIARHREEIIRKAENYLEALAEKTGGRYQAARQIRDIEAAFALVAEELRHQYNIGFYPQKTAELEETRQLKVRVDRANTAVRARASYIAKPQK